MHVYIVGSTGQVGSELSRATWPSLVTSVTCLNRSQLDICNAQAVAELLAEADVIINAAAYTAVDKAETDRRRAFDVNCDGPANLATLCARTDALLVHLSTDYVFDGTKSSPYTEDDETSPINVYGESKLAGEKAIAQTCRTHIILRTSWVVSAFSQNFVKTILRVAAANEELRVVADQFGRPTPAKHLANLLIRVAQRYAERDPIPFGTYHFAAAGRTTWHGLAEAIVNVQAEITNKTTAVRPIGSADYPTPARRPRNSELDTTKIERALSFTAAPWQPGVEEIIREVLRRN